MEQSIKVFNIKIIGHTYCWELKADATTWVLRDSPAVLMSGYIADGIAHCTYMHASMELVSARMMKKIKAAIRRSSRS